MKKLYTIDDFMIAFISALGYGFGYNIPMYFGWSQTACIVACFAFGIVIEEIISKIVFSKIIQQKTANRVITFVVILIVFIVAEFVSLRLLDTSLMEDLEEEFAWVVGIPIAGFVVNLCIRGYRIRKVRKVYGDGSEGYIFDPDKEDVEDMNKQNKPITGSYDEDLAIKTKTGIYVGEKNKDIINYFGIPYAEAPVGNLRWKAPRPLPESNKVFEAVNYGASPIQVEHGGAILKHHRQSEDCLTLNISVAEDSSESLKPVLVLFHESDFSCGGSADPLLEGDNFVTNHSDIVFVSFNYRLGIFGFIDFSEVPGGEDYPDALNLGLLDQIAALQWIKENIASFGGDPDRITVFGVDSGATSIILLAASKRAKGLFKRAFAYNAIIESVYDTPKESRMVAKDLLKETQTTTMEELLKLDSGVLKDAAQKLWKNACIPTCDGNLIPSDIYQALSDGAASGIEFVIGIPGNQVQEVKSFLGAKKYMRAVLLAVEDIKNQLDENTYNKAKACVEEQMESSTELEVNSELVNQWGALCIYRVAERLKQGGNQVHMIYWDEKALIEKLGTGTVDATGIILGNSEALQMYGSVIDKDLSEILQSLLKKFISREALEFYRNEIYGMDAFEWEAFPKALIVSDGKLVCDTIADRIT